MTPQRNRFTIVVTIAAALAGSIVLGALPAAANPTFARMTGHTCAVCHVPAQEPALNSVGLEFKTCGFSFCKGPPPATPAAPQPMPAPAPARPLPQPTAAGPSFSCTGRLTPTEGAICADDQLGALDRRYNDLYDRALAAAGNPERERAIARAFLDERNSCGGDSDCIRQVYVRRLTAMQQGR